MLTAIPLIKSNSEDRQTPKKGERFHILSAVTIEIEINKLVNAVQYFNSYLFSRNWTHIAWCSAVINSRIYSHSIKIQFCIILRDNIEKFHLIAERRITAAEEKKYILKNVEKIMIFINFIKWKTAIQYRWKISSDRYRP